MSKLKSPDVKHPIRYGSAPLPRLVPAKEIEAIVNELEDEETKQLVMTWYKKDWNARPPVYVLQPISMFFPTLCLQRYTINIPTRSR